MDFLEAMHTYFKGERIESLAFVVPVGVILIALAVVALRVERAGFAWGLAVPLILFGLVGLGVGSAVGLRTASQVETLEKEFHDNPGEMVAKELPRMRTVNKNWPVFVTAWAACMVIGLGLRFAMNADWAHGVAIGFMLIGAIGFTIDGFAERRAKPYTEALEALAAEHGVADAAAKPPD